jgi:hypothetical protein
MCPTIEGKFHPHHLVASRKLTFRSRHRSVPSPRAINDTPIGWKLRHDVRVVSSCRALHFAGADFTAINLAPPS